MATPRTLVVIRHAKAEQSERADVERRLTEDGVRDATEAGAWLAGRGVVPDHALVSSAARAEQTWAAIADGAGWDLEPTLDDALYDAEPENALDLLRRAPDVISTVVLVGHNPTMASLAQLLDDGEGDAEAGNQMALGFPTCAVAVFGYDGSWADLAEASAAVVGFHVGRA